MTYFGTLHYPCHSDTHTDGKQDCDGNCAAVARGERDALAAEVVALREALARAEKHHHQRSGQRCYCGFSWPCPERPRIRALLDDPSPAVAEIERLVELGRKAADKRCPECKALEVYEDEGARTCNKCGWSPSTGAD